MSIKRSPREIPHCPVFMENIPNELKQMPRWAMWQWIWNGKKWDKPPYRVEGGKAANNKSAHWGEFQKAVSALGDRKRFSGIGFTLGGKGCGYTVVDIDNCRDRDSKEIAPWATEVIEYLNSYTEVSPSGEGVKIWLRGSMPEGNWANKRDNFEVYDKGRYLTITGQVIEDLNEISDGGDGLLRFLVDNMQSESSESPQREPDDVEWLTECAKEAITYIDPDCEYDEWVRVGMALHWLSDDLFDVWDKWSSEGGKYEGTSNCRQHWESFDSRKNSVKIATLFYLASQNGFVMPVRSYEKSDYGVARRVIAKIQGRIYWVQEWRTWACWDGRKFATETDSDLVEAIIRTSKEMISEAPEGGDKEADKVRAAYIAWCKKYQSKNGVDAVIRFCRSLLSTKVEAFDTNRLMLHCENGVLEFGDKVTFTGHDPKLMNTQLSPVVYSSDAKCPRWEQFIDEVTQGDTELGTYLQKLCGYCLTGRIDQQEIYILYGDGNNGKSVFAEILLNLLGDYGSPARQELLMAQSSQHVTDVADLYGRRCVVAQETDESCRLRENQVKVLTGGSVIRARRLYENAWSFKPTHKIMLATNNMPTVRGTDDGIWRRIRIIPFRASFQGREDRGLEGKLIAELPGILNWAIYGYKLFQLESLNEPPCMSHSRTRFRDDMNTVRQFVDDRCILDEEHRTETGTLYQAYKLYCEQEGHYAFSARKLHTELTRIGVTSVRSHGERYKSGIALRSELEPVS